MQNKLFFKYFFLISSLTKLNFLLKFCDNFILQALFQSAQPTPLWEKRRVRIREARKHADPDLDSQHWYRVFDNEIVLWLRSTLRFIQVIPYQPPKKGWSKMVLNGIKLSLMDKTVPVPFFKFFNISFVQGRRSGHNYWSWKSPSFSILHSAGQRLLRCYFLRIDFSSLGTASWY